ncbi:MAG: hypothetical protein M1538_00865 [Candidatus Marsarchaeota archaeon]|jgi:hypothetical protein|nr:hypothetical protein [Candidatus Marsarchaeota archaeon]
MVVLKGQFWSIDAMFGLFIFSIALIIAAFIWTSVNNQIATSLSSSTTIIKLETQTFALSLLSEGAPNNWYSVINTTNTTTWQNIYVGLESSSKPKSISPNKLAALISMSNYDYQATKQSLGIGYDYYISIEGKLLDINIGRNPLAYNAITIFKVNETSFYDNEPVNVEVYLWSNTTLGIS